VAADNDPQALLDAERVVTLGLRAHIDAIEGQLAEMQALYPAPPPEQAVLRRMREALAGVRIQARDPETWRQPEVLQGILRNIERTAAAGLGEDADGTDHPADGG